MKKNPDVVIGTEEAQLWQRVKEDAEAAIKRNEEMLIFNKKVLEMAKKELKKKSFSFNLTHGRKK